MANNLPKIILASGSAGRKMMLDNAYVPFTATPAYINERAIIDDGLDSGHNDATTARVKVHTTGTDFVVGCARRFWASSADCDTPSIASWDSTGTSTVSG